MSTFETCVDVGLGDTNGVEGWYCRCYGLVLLLGQRFTSEEFLVQRSSLESYDNKKGRKALYKWSLKEVVPWL